MQLHAITFEEKMKTNRYLLLLSLLLLGSCGTTPSISENTSTSASDLTSDLTSALPSEVTSVVTSEEPSISEQPSTSVSSGPILFNGYYTNVDLNLEGTALLNALKARVNLNFMSDSYGGAWNSIKVGDEDVNNSSNIIQIYSRFTRPKSEQNAGSGTDNWNREHVVPQSKMGCNTSTNGPCTDYNNLFASDTKVNADRGNLPFGKLTSGTFIKDSKGRETPARKSSVFDPGSEARGEVARATLYMVIKWNFNVNVNGNLDTLLEWNREYPPTEAREIKRNDAVQRYQNNRNPFIDYPYLADAIWA